MLHGSPGPLVADLVPATFLLGTAAAVATVFALSSAPFARRPPPTFSRVRSRLYRRREFEPKAYVCALAEINRLQILGKLGNEAAGKIFFLLSLCVVPYVFEYAVQKVRM